MRNNEPTIHIIMRDGVIDTINTLNTPKDIQIVVQNHDFGGDTDYFGNPCEIYKANTNQSTPEEIEYILNQFRNYI